jgi:hypothetical protein
MKIAKLNTSLVKVDPYINVFTYITSIIVILAGLSACLAIVIQYGYIGVIWGQRMDNCSIGACETNCSNEGDHTCSANIEYMLELGNQTYFQYGIITAAVCGDWNDPNNTDDLNSTNNLTTITNSTICYYNVGYIQSSLSLVQMYPAVFGVVFLSILIFMTLLLVGVSIGFKFLPVMGMI